MHDREFLDRCEACDGHWIHSLTKVQHDLQTDQTIRHLMDEFTKQAAREADDYREHPGDEPDSMVFYQPG